MAQVRQVRASPGLPPRRTRLLGRDTDVALLRDLVLHADEHLLTLTGVGGVGKTALAMEVARAAAPEMPDGTWLVNLASITGAEEVAPACCAALGLVDHVAPAESLLADHLAPRQAVLCLDNCEHLARQVALLVERLLRVAPDLRIIATSRTPLHVRDEIVYPVAPLPVTAPTAASDPSAVAATPSFQLFLERARAVDPDFEASPEVAATIAGICRQVDGLPLAIELAAAGLAASTPTQIAAGLRGDGPGVLEADADGTDRHRTIEATLDWSLDLVSSAARRLFPRLAVFAGGWTSRAAHEVCAAGDDLVGRALVELVEHSLVVRSSDSGAVRFSLLAPVAEDARRRLAEAGETEVFERAHAAYYLALARSRSEGSLFSAPRDLDAIGAEDENCQTALRRALARGDLPVAVGLAEALREYWRVRGLLRRGADLVAEVLDLLGPAATREQAGLLLTLGDYHQLLGEHDRALAEATQALELATACGFVREDVVARGIIGNVATDRGDHETARVWYGQVLAALGSSAASPASAFLRANLGTIALREGDLAEAADQLERARVGFEALAPIWYLGRVLALLGAVKRREGQHRRSGQLLEGALEWLRRYGARAEAIDCLEELGRLAIDAGDAARAATLLSAANALRDEIGIAGGAGRSALRSDVERVRDMLQPARFAAAWGRGRELTLDEAAAFVASAPAAPAGSAAVDLTPRELEVAALVASGLSNKAIAARLGIAASTARIHVERILGKLGCTSRVQVADRLRANG